MEAKILQAENMPKGTNHFRVTWREKDGKIWSQGFASPEPEILTDFLKWQNENAVVRFVPGNCMAKILSVSATGFKLIHFETPFYKPEPFFATFQEVCFPEE